MKTHGLTTEQKEREHASCYGRYDETTNSWLEICDLTDYEQCDFCGYWFEEEELKQEDTEFHFRYCSDCEKYADTGDGDEDEYDEEEEERYRMEMSVLFSELDENEKRIIRAINKLNKAV